MPAVLPGCARGCCGSVGWVRGEAGASTPGGMGQHVLAEEGKHL